jgi:hypothetical protein
MGKIPHYYKLARSLVFTLSVVMFIIYKIGDIDLLFPIISLLAIICILMSIPGSSLPNKIFSLLFLIVGTWLAFKRGVDLYSYISFHGDMLYILSLLAILPLLAIPLKIGRYDQSIHQPLSMHAKSSTQLHRIVSSISFLLSSFLNLATIPIMYQCIKKSVKQLVSTKTNHFLCLSILHGFTVAIAWSPFSGAVAFALETTNVDWGTVFFKLFTMSVFGLLLNWFIFFLRSKSVNTTQSFSEMALTQEDFELKPFVNKPMIKLLQLVLVVLLLLAIDFGLNNYVSWGLIMTTTIIALPFAFFWSMVIKKGLLFLKETKIYAFKNMSHMSDQFAIFLSAGFFVKALQYSGYNEYINTNIIQFSQYIGETLFLILLPIFTLSFGLIGMHPITTIMLLAELLDPSVLGISAEHLAIAMIGGAVMTFSIGPFSATMNMFSMLIHQSSFRIAWWNVLYTIGYFVLLVLLLLCF